MVTDLRTVPPGMEPQSARLVMGATVVASDYLKTFLSGFRMVFGGEMKVLISTMINRARREARLRMIESARQAGALAVYQRPIRNVDRVGNDGAERSSHERSALLRNGASARRSVSGMDERPGHRVGRIGVR